MYGSKIFLLLVSILLIVSCKSTDDIRSTQNMLKEKGDYSVSVFECNFETDPVNLTGTAELVTTIQSNNNVEALLCEWSYRLSYTDGSSLVIDEEDYTAFSWVANIKSATEYNLESEIHLQLMEKVLVKGAPVRISFKAVMLDIKGKKSAVTAEIKL